MQKNWNIRGLRGHGEDLLLMLIFVMVYQNLSSCWCLNEEGELFQRVVFFLLLVFPVINSSTPFCFEFCSLALDLCCIFVCLLRFFFFLLCVCVCVFAGLALLRVRERIESDPFGALRGWHEYGGETDPCLWFGVECSNGKVVVL